MEGRGNRQHDGALGALFGSDRSRLLDSRLAAGNDQLAAAIVVGDLADAENGSLFTDCRNSIVLQPDDRCHRALAHRHGSLHGIAADAEKPCGIGNREGAGSTERGIFAERMASDIRDGVRELQTPRFQNPHDRHGHRHERRLGIGRQRQRFFRAIPHDVGKLLAERVINLLEHSPCFRIAIGEFLAHADGLASLTGKCECNTHGMWSFLSGLAFILFDFHSHSGLRSQGLKPFGTPSTRFCRSIFPFLFIIFFLALRQFPITFMPPFKYLAKHRDISMKQRLLGRTGISVSEICLGTMTWGTQNTEAEAHAQMDYALENGVNFFDTAELYPTTPRFRRNAGTDGRLYRHMVRKDRQARPGRACHQGRRFRA
ncbi:hypothetical protein AGR1B_Cc110055 [Agrobacterium fabacearum S56]|nr:hypothetical protein AGR1B_Cc110055 [Agrobacterium fabacearum S56]